MGLIRLWAAMRGALFVVVGGSVRGLLRLWSEAAVQEQAAMPRCGKTALGLMRLWAAIRGASFVVAGGSVARLLRLGSEAAVPRCEKTALFSMRVQAIFV